MTKYYLQSYHVSDINNKEYTYRMVCKRKYIWGLISVNVNKKYTLPYATPFEKYYEFWNWLIKTQAGF